MNFNGCYSCGLQGHWAKNCPDKRKKKQRSLEKRLIRQKKHEEKRQLKQLMEETEYKSNTTPIISGLTTTNKAKLLLDILAPTME